MHSKGDNSLTSSSSNCRHPPFRIFISSSSVLLSPFLLLLQLSHHVLCPLPPYFSSSSSLIFFADIRQDPMKSRDYFKSILGRAAALYSCMSRRASPPPQL